MSTTKKLASLLGAGALLFATFGTALAVTPASDAGIVPTEHAGNIVLVVTEGGQDAADCDAADGIQTGDASGSDTTGNGVTVDWTYNAGDKSVDFTATGGLVTFAYIKGGNAYNEYDYTGEAGGGIAADGGLFAPDNGGDGPAGLSHAVFCTTPGEEETEEPSFSGGGGGETDLPSFSGGGGGETDTPTEPDTATIGGNGTSGPADGAWLLMVGLGVLLASIVVLTPARAKSRR